MSVKAELLFQFDSDILQLYKDRAIITTEMANEGTEEGEVWQALHEVVRTLGQHGMSSDESDYRTVDSVQHKFFRPKKMNWRSREVTTLLKRIDKGRNRKNAYGNDHAGNKPRERRRARSATKSSRTAPP